MKGNGTAAYQLATVIDDAESGVNLVIRGDDLLPSTARQILLQRALGLPSPAWRHLPLLVGPDGRRLAKRHGDTSLAHLRRTGWTAEEVVGFLAWTAGLAGFREPLVARDLVSQYLRVGNSNPEAETARDRLVTDGQLLASWRSG